MDLCTRPPNVTLGDFLVFLRRMKSNWPAFNHAGTNCPGMSCPVLFPTGRFVQLHHPGESTGEERARGFKLSAPVSRQQVHQLRWEPWAEGLKLCSGPRPFHDCRDREQHPLGGRLTLIRKGEGPGVGREGWPELVMPKGNKSFQTRRQKRTPLPRGH